MRSLIETLRGVSFWLLRSLSVSTPTVSSALASVSSTAQGSAIRRESDPKRRSLW